MIFKKMKKFEILEYKADLKIRVFGKDLRELFLNAIVGMFEEAGYESEGEEIKREIKISSLDLPSLLVDFLSEVVYLCEVNREVYHKVLFKNLTEKELKGILIGKPLKRMGVHIKAVTYHDLDIHQKEDKTWQATILFDI